MGMQVLKRGEELVGFMLVPYWGLQGGTGARGKLVWAVPSHLNPGPVITPLAPQHLPS